MSTTTTTSQSATTSPLKRLITRHLLSTPQITGYGLGSALLFPLVAAVVLLILTKGRLSYKPDRVVQPAEALRPAETPAANV
jgi:hypothetical protein